MALRTQPYAAQSTVLERVRRGRGVTREALAARVGVDPVTIWRIERRGARPRRLTALGIGLALGVDPAKLFPETTSAPAGRTGAEQ